MLRKETERLLPRVFQRTLRPGSPLTAIVELMSALQHPIEEALARQSIHFDARRASAKFVPFLSRWVDLDYLLAATSQSFSSRRYQPTLSTGHGRLRELIATTAQLSRWRGTSHGLVSFLITATGDPGFEIEENPIDEEGRPRAFHLTIRAPEGSRRYRTLLERIIEHEKPAYVSYELRFGGAGETESRECDSRGGDDA